MTIELMGELSSGLAQSRQVIAVELQGHGRTADVDRPLTCARLADDTVALIRELGVGPADVYGYSLGGGTALQLAIRYPGLVRKLVAVSASYSSAGMHPEVRAGIEQHQARALRPHALARGIRPGRAAAGGVVAARSGLAHRCQALSPGLTFATETGGVNTQASPSYVVRRVAVRAGLGLWQQRTGVLLAAVACLTIGGYLLVTAPNGPMPALAQGSQLGASSDCADTAIAAVADKSPSAAQRAYQCMTPGFQQRVPEQSFIQQIQSQAVPNATRIDRVGEHQSTTSTLVYYAVDSRNGSVGYIVYLGSDGKVVKIE